MMGSGVLVGQIKEYVLFDLPFLFKTPQEVDAALDGPLGRKLIDRLPEKGLIGLSYWEHGFRSLTNSRRPVEKWEDIQGLKIRVIQAPLYLDAFNAMGANAVPCPCPSFTRRWKRRRWTAKRTRWFRSILEVLRGAEISLHHPARL